MPDYRINNVLIKSPYDITLMQTLQGKAVQDVEILVPLPTTLSLALAWKCLYTVSG